MQSIGLDIDGVVYPWVQAVCTYWRMYKNYTGTDYDFSANIGKMLSSKDLDFLATIPHLYTSIVPTKELVSLLSKLGNKYNLFYITARPNSVLRVTEKYMRQIPFGHNLIFTKDKSSMAKLLKLDFFVEDNIKNAESLSKVCTTFLVKTPYNRFYTGNVPFIENIFELERILL